MKKLLIIIIFSFTFFAPGLYAQCTHEIEASVFIIDGNETAFEPGDVVCLKAGNKDFLLIKNVHGTSDKPIVFINNGGAVIIDTDHFYGIKTAHCSFIKIIGNGDENTEYGIQVKRVAQGAGISIDELSTDVEIANIEVGNTFLAGLFAKTDPDCSFASSRDNFTMYNLSIHDCYFHHIGDEGFYIGHSKYGQGVYLSDCDTLIYPHLLKGVKVYNNVLEHIGLDGIQVSSSDDDCSIFDNTIRYDSEKEIVWQMSGILIGGGSKCDCYNNKIFDGRGDGIDVLGLGGFKIFNNLIVRAGKDFEPGNPNSAKHGIYVGDAVTLSNLNFKLFNNTIVSPKSYGITYNNHIASKSLIYNNLIVDPGKKNEGDKAFVNNLAAADKIELRNNIYNDEVSQSGFVKPEDGNYSLTEGSVAIDFGKNLSAEGIVFDILNKPRPYNVFYDVGAYEWQGPDGINPDVSDIISLGSVYPNPTNNVINLNLIIDESQFVDCRLLSTSGTVLQNFRFHCPSMAESHHKLLLNDYNAAVYILEIRTKNGSAYRKIIIQ